MSDSETPSSQELITDYLLGRCDPSAREQIARRIEAEPRLRSLHADLSNTFAALDLTVEAEPPADLVERTMARIRGAKQTDALLAREQLARRDVIRPTFSMREIAAVAGIVLVIGVTFSVWFRQADRHRLQTQCAQNVVRIGTGLAGFADRNDGYMPAATAPRQRWLPAANEPAVSNSSALFQLVKDRSVDPPSFQCPAVGGDSFAVEPGMTDFPAGKYVNYSFQHSLGPKGLWREDPRLNGVTSSMAILADSSPVFCNGQFRSECVGRPAGDNHGGAGQTVLYLDGHEDFKTKASVGVGGNNIYLVDGVNDYKGTERPASPTDSFLLPAWSPKTTTSNNGSK